MTAETIPAGEVHSRYCTHCQEHKSIRGVWYLVQETEVDDAEFYCETCFTVPREPRAETAPPVDPSRVPVTPEMARGELDPTIPRW